MSTPAHPVRNPYFGELHVHTAWSLDAFVIAALAGPEEAFRYAKGEPTRSSLNNAEETRVSRPLTSRRSPSTPNGWASTG